MVDSLRECVLTMFLRGRESFRERIEMRERVWGNRGFYIWERVCVNDVFEREREF